MLVTNLSDIYLCPPLHALFDEDFPVFMDLGFAVAGLNERLLFRDFSATAVSSVWWCSHVTDLLQFMMNFRSAVAASLEIFHQDAGDITCQTKCNKETTVVPAGKNGLRSVSGAFILHSTPPPHTTFNLTAIEIMSLHPLPSLPASINDGTGSWNSGRKDT